MGAQHRQLFISACAATRQRALCSPSALPGAPQFEIAPLQPPIRIFRKSRKIGQKIDLTLAAWSVFLYCGIKGMGRLPMFGNINALGKPDFFM